jgi:hypothetical protein
MLITVISSRRQLNNKSNLTSPIFFFYMSTKEGKEEFELVTSVLFGVVLAD